MKYILSLVLLSFLSSCGTEAHYKFLHSANPKFNDFNVNEVQEGEKIAIERLKVNQGNSLNTQIKACFVTPGKNTTFLKKLNGDWGKNGECSTLLTPLSNPDKSNQEYFLVMFRSNPGLTSLTQIDFFPLQNNVYSISNAKFSISSESDITYFGDIDISFSDFTKKSPKINFTVNSNQDTINFIKKNYPGLEIKTVKTNLINAKDTVISQGHWVYSNY